MLDPEQRRRWVSDARFAPFLAAAERDDVLAADLYEWHAELAGRLFSTFHHFEILVRNAIDERLGDGQPQVPLRDTWLMDFGVLQPNGIKQVIVAVERLEKGKEISRSRVVAGVSFGFWAGLFSKGYEELRRHHLRHVFAAAALQRKDLTAPMRELQTFRNRLAHHDCLLRQPIGHRHDQMMRIADWIDPAAAEWIAGQSGVAELLEERPA
jgi:hypothetical protein